jgi:hypothetical protein
LYLNYTEVLLLERTENDEIFASVASSRGYLAKSQEQASAAFINNAGVMQPEIVVDRAKMLRNNPGPSEAGFVNQFNDMILAQAAH